MMNEDMIRNIDYLREKANVSYEEAMTLLERNDNNVMRALVELEQQGRVYTQAQAESANAQQGPSDWQKRQNEKREAKEKAASFFQRAFQTRLVVERKQEDGDKATVANLSVPFVIGATIIAPYLAVATAAITLVCGYQVKVKKEDRKPQTA